MRVHHNTVKKAKKFGITLEIIENDIVASKDGATLASGPVGNVVLDQAIAKLAPAKPEGLLRRAAKAVKKAVTRKVRDEDLEDGEFFENDEYDAELAEEEGEGHSVVKSKYKKKYRPFKMTNGDDIAQQVREHVMVKDEETNRLRLDHPKFLRFAKANGCWDPAYATLNHGMQRMNVVNRLRGKVRRDKHEIKWPT